MDIKITYNSLKKFLRTDIGAEEIAAKVSLCGPTFDRIHKAGDDYIFEIEAITNRIDSASVYGVAREAVAILNQLDTKAEIQHDPYKIEVEKHSDLPETFKIDIEDQSLTPRFSAIALSDIEVHDSPKEVTDFLEKCGERSINNVVDITNEITLLYGMPCHIFDLNKIERQYLFVRKSHALEVVETLDQTKNKLLGGDIIIEDGGKRIIDLCGIMGGSVAEVDQNTKNILLIVPVYNPKTIRKTSLYLQKRTLAAQIYEKQPDIELCDHVLTAAIKLFEERAKAKVSSRLFDYYPSPLPSKTVKLDLDWLNNFIGKEIDRDRVVTILDDLGFGGSEIKDNIIDCIVPSFRYYDINIREDLAEEVARVYGYFRLPSVLPCVNLKAQNTDPVFSNELKAKKYLADIGYSEVLNNSLISQDQIENSGLKIDDALKLNNALSRDYEYLRSSLLPGLITNFKNNSGRNTETINIFELSNVYAKRTKGKLPDEVSTLGLISNENFTKTKGSIEALFDHLNISSFEFLKNEDKNLKVFDPDNTAIIKCGTQSVGFLGLLDPQISNNFGLDGRICVAEINFQKLVSSINNNYIYKPISNYPSVVEDITIDSPLAVGEIISKMRGLSEYLDQITYTQSFGNKHTFKLTFSSTEKNLDQNLVNTEKNKIFALFS